jgi:anti-anti-sigma factor
MNIQDVLVGEAVIIALSGKIRSCEDAIPVRAVIKEHLSHDKKNFVIDMADVPWMNSEGIGLLASAMATIKAANGKIVLANISEKVEQVLTVTKCNKIIDHFESREAAIQSFNSD